MEPPTKKSKKTEEPQPLVLSNNGRVDGSNLSLLLEYLRKDPESYYDEFLERFTHFIELGKLLQIQPSVHRMELNPLLELINFLGSVAFCYPKEGRIFAENVIATLKAQSAALDPDLRMELIKAMVSLRNRNLIDQEKTLDLFFDLIKCDDKQLRKFILGALISFIRMHHRKFRRADTKMQTYVYAKLKDPRLIVAHIAQLLTIDSFRRGFWKDAKTANVIAETIFNTNSKVHVCAMRFFLRTANEEDGIDSDTEDEDEHPTKEPKSVKEAMTAFRHAKKTKKRRKMLENAKKAEKRQKKIKKGTSRKECNLEAIRLLYDPQSIADRLFGLLDGKKNERFALRLLRMALLARLIGVHKLQTLGFYSYLQKYLQPKQREVTRILLYAVQACHDLVPGDIVQTLARCIAQNFISDSNSPEAMTVGINAIRELFVTCAEFATEELIQDLAEYKSYKNKNVSMAAKSLINQFRISNPNLLRAKDRGRPEPKKRDEDDSDMSDSDAEEQEEWSDEEKESEEEDDKGRAEGADGLPLLSNIVQFHKKVGRQNKKERLEQIKEGRSDRDEYKKKKKNGPHVGRTNANMAKRKNYQMVQHKMRGKNRQRSFRDQQTSLRNYLIRQSGRKVV